MKLNTRTPPAPAAIPPPNADLQARAARPAPAPSGASTPGATASRTDTPRASAPGAGPTTPTARDVGGRRAASPTGAIWTQHGLAAPALTEAPQLTRAVAGALDRLIDATPEWRAALGQAFAAGHLRVLAEHDRPELGGARLLANGLLVDFGRSRVLGRVVDADGAQQGVGPDMKMIWGWLKSSQDDYVDEDYVEELTGRYKDGDPWLEPAEVKEDGTIKDGHHRLAAQERAGTAPDFVVVDDDDKVVGQSTGETEHGKPWWMPF